MISGQRPKFVPAMRTVRAPKDCVGAMTGTSAPPASRRARLTGATAASSHYETSVTAGGAYVIVTADPEGAPSRRTTTAATPSPGGVKQLIVHC